MTDLQLSWAEDQIASGLATKAEVLATLGIHRTTYERRLRARGRRAEDQIPLPPGGFRCPTCYRPSLLPVCLTCHSIINPLLAPPPQPPPIRPAPKPAA